MSAYPNQPMSSQAGWPEQPPQSSRDQWGNGQYGNDQYGQQDYGYGQQDYGQYDNGQYDNGQYGYDDRRRPRKRRRGRRIGFLIFLIVVFGALYIGDGMARSYAQNLLASKIQSASKLPDKPTVSIKGWPFLTQVATRDISQVDISTPSIRESVLELRNVQATATGVHISSSFNGATVDTITGTALIPFSSLVQEIGVHGLTLADDPSGGPNEAKITLSSIPGLPAGLPGVPTGPVSGVAKVTQTGPSTISIKTESLGNLPLGQLGSVGDYTINIPHLPMGMSLSGVSVTSQGLTAQVSAHNTTLSGSGSGL